MLVDGDVVVLVFQCYFFQFVVLVVGGIVDQYVEVVQLFLQLGDGGLEGGNVVQVVMMEQWFGMIGCCDVIVQCFVGFGGDIDEGYMCILLCECFDDGCIDVSVVVGDEDVFVFEVGEVCQLYVLGSIVYEVFLQVGVCVQCGIGIMMKGRGLV